MIATNDVLYYEILKLTRYLKKQKEHKDILKHVYESFLLLFTKIETNIQMNELDISEVLFPFISMFESENIPSHIFVVFMESCEVIIKFAFVNVSSETICSIIDSITKCKFEIQDLSKDEIVLFKLLGFVGALVDCIQPSSGLRNTTFISIVKTSLVICLQKKLGKTLKLLSFNWINDFLYKYQDISICSDVLQHSCLLLDNPDLKDFEKMILLKFITNLLRIYSFDIRKNNVEASIQLVSDKLCRCLVSLITNTEIKLEVLTCVDVIFQYFKDILKLQMEKLFEHILKQVSDLGKKHDNFDSLEFYMDWLTTVNLF